MDRKRALSITCLITPLFFLGVALCFIPVSQAEEYPPPLSQTLSEIVLTDVNGQEFSDGILLDNFEYLNSPEQMGWEFINLCFPYPYPSIWHPPYLNNVIDFEQGSRVLDVYRSIWSLFIWTLSDQTLAVKKKAAYTDPDGVVFDSIPADFNFLHFKVQAPLAVEQFQTFRFEVQVKTRYNNGYAKIVIIPKDKLEGVSPVDDPETVQDDVETLSHDPQNPSLIEMYIGKSYADGKWHQVKIDLNAAIKKYSAFNEQVDQILSVIVRGNQYRLDDILFTKTDPDNTVPHIFHIGPVYLQLYGQPSSNSVGRWIYAEDPDLGLRCVRTADGGYLFPQIAGDADADGVPTALHINPDGSIENQEDITESTIAIYNLGPNGRPDLASPRTPADEDIDWIFTAGDCYYPSWWVDFIEVAAISNGAPFTQEEAMTFPPYLPQQDGVLIPNMSDSEGRYNVLSNPVFALGAALANSGYGTFPNAIKIIPFGMVFEDMIVTCRVSDGMATDKETFPVSVVNYPVTNNPPIIENVEDQVFEVGVVNYYQIVVLDPDLEDMEGLTYHAYLNWPFPTYVAYEALKIIDSKTGLITFTPPWEYDFDCIVKVVDPRGMMAVCQFTIFCKISDKYSGTWFNHPPVILGELDSTQTIRAGEMFIANEMHFMDPDEDKVYWSCNVGSVGNNGVYTFKSMFPGYYQVQITAYDIRGGAATTEFVIHVAPWWSL